MRRGRISYSKVRAVTRVATPENEQTLLDVALAGTAAARGAHRSRVAPRRPRRRAGRGAAAGRGPFRCGLGWTTTGWWWCGGRLTPEVGAVLRRALDAACDAARRAPEPRGRAKSRRLPAKRLAAAEAAVGSGEEPNLAQRQADAIGVVAEAALAGGLDKGTAGDRYQVVLHVDAPALAEPRDVPAGTPGTTSAAAGRSGDGSPLGAEAPLPHGTQPPSAVAPDGQALSGCAPRATGRRRTGHVVRGQPDRARRGGAASTSPPRPPGAWRAKPPPSRCATDLAARSSDVGRRTRTIPARPAPGAGGPRPAVPLSPGCGNRRCDSHHVEQLGRRRADGARQLGAALPAAIGILTSYCF